LDAVLTRPMNSRLAVFFTWDDLTDANAESASTNRPEAWNHAAPRTAADGKLCRHGVSRHRTGNTRPTTRGKMSRGCTCRAHGCSVRTSRACSRRAPWPVPCSTSSSTCRAQRLIVTRALSAHLQRLRSSCKLLASHAQAPQSSTAVPRWIPRARAAFVHQNRVRLHSVAFGRQNTWLPAPLKAQLAATGEGAFSVILQ
jgi:hypothetical protein